MTGPSRLLLDWLDTVTPERRRLWCARLFLLVSIVEPICFLLWWPLHVIGTEVMVAVTLVLSWEAVRFSSAQLIVETDIRKEQAADG